MQGVHATGQIVDKLTLGVGPKAKEGYDQRRNGGQDMAHAAWGALGDVFGIKSNPKTRWTAAGCRQAAAEAVHGPVAKDSPIGQERETPSETVLRLDRSRDTPCASGLGKNASQADRERVQGKLQKGDGYHQVAQARVLENLSHYYGSKEEALKDPSYGKYMKDEIQSLKNHNNGAPVLANKGNESRRLERRSSKSRTPRRNSLSGSEISARCTRARSPSPSRHRPDSSGVRARCISS